jgi:hypothetical protein
MLHAKSAIYDEVLEHQLTNGKSRTNRTGGPEALKSSHRPDSAGESSVRKLTARQKTSA